jgi:hypothetical protein
MRAVMPIPLIANVLNRRGRNRTGAAGSCDSCLAVGPTELERVRYFPRQLITADDLTQEQDYLRAKLRRHNRLLHGWGVVCGCEVVPGGEWSVTVGPGYVLAPTGDEILIPGPVTVDLRAQDVDGNAAGSCSGVLDPWCSPIRGDRAAGVDVYVAVGYDECMSRPVRVQGAGCGCDDGGCEHSRVRDGYAIRVLTEEELPAFYRPMPSPPAGPACPRPCDCADDEWVVLAKVRLEQQIDADDIDNTTYRRLVAGYGGQWARCATASQLLKVQAVRFLGPVDHNGEAEVLAELTAPASPREIVPIRLGGNDVLDVIEVEFTGEVAAESVRDGESITVEGIIEPDTNNELTRIPGTVSLPFPNIVRWDPVEEDRILHLPRAVAGRVEVLLRITLKGSGPAPVRARRDGQALDGEPGGSLPSGDGVAGEDFWVWARLSLRPG